MATQRTRNCYLVSYDSAGGEDYGIIDAIKAYGSWAHITQSTWAIVTESSHKEIRDNLIQHLPEESRLFVLRSGSVGAWRNVMCSNTWLKKNL